MHGTRVAVVGTTGSGKSTLAASLARSLGVPHVEIDALFHGPGWTERPVAPFRALVAAAVAGDGWVVDGNYDSVRDLVWPRATDIVWLDYPRRVVMWRVVKRSVVRAVTRRELWNGNREDWRTWLRADHPIRWAWTSHAQRRAEYEALAAGDPRWHRLTHPALILCYYLCYSLSLDTFSFGAHCGKSATSSCIDVRTGDPRGETAGLGTPIWTLFPTLLSQGGTVSC